jgi:hypothetical protein
MQDHIDFARNSPQPNYLPRYALEWEKANVRISTSPLDQKTQFDRRVWKFPNTFIRDKWISDGPANPRAAGYREPAKLSEVKNEIYRAERRAMADPSFVVWTPRPEANGACLPSTDEMDSIYLKRGRAREYYGAGFSVYVPPILYADRFYAGPDCPLNRLTHRQWMIAAMVADGREDGEIAMRLGLSVHTVHAAVAAILKRWKDIPNETTFFKRHWIRIVFIEAREKAERLAEEQAAAEEIDVESMLGVAVKSALPRTPEKIN